jgi:hypothetical protein
MLDLGIDPAARLSRAQATGICSQGERGMKNHEDFLTHEGAVNLKKWLEEYWHRYPTVRFYIEEKQLGRGRIYFVRSNLISGLPPAAAEKATA